MRNNDNNRAYMYVDLYGCSGIIVFSLNGEKIASN